MDFDLLTLRFPSSLYSGFLTDVTTRYKSYTSSTKGECWVFNRPGGSLWRPAVNPAVKDNEQKALF
jgi:hypothetical protein